MTRKSGSGKKNGVEVKKRKNKKCSSSSSSSTASSSIMETKTNQRVRKKKTGCVNNGKQQSTKQKKAKPVKSNNNNANAKTKARESKGKCKTVAVVNPKKRKLIDEEIEIIDTRSCKRMASLNASAILASLSEKRVNLNQSRPPITSTRSTESTRSTRSTVVKILETEISSSESRLQVPDLGSSQYPERRLSTKQSRLIESTRSTGSTRSTRSTVFKILETEISSSESRVHVSSPEPDLGSPQYPERRLSTKQSRSIESTRSTASTRSTGSTVVKILETKISSSDSQVQVTSPVSNIGSQYPAEKRVSKQSRAIDSSKRSTGSSKSTGSTVVKIFETKISSSDSQHITPVSNIGSQYPDKRMSKQSRSSEAKRSAGSSKSTGSTVVKIRETKISSSDSAHVVTPSVHNIGTLQYPHERRTMSKPCRSIESTTTTTGATTMAKIFETEINSNSILQVPQIPNIPNIGRQQYPPHYASAFSVPHHINHAASINYPTESYGFYQHSVGCGPIMQPIHDPYIRAYSLHKPIPYYASQMAHHPDQTYREFNPIQSSYHQPQHLSHSSLTLQLHTPLLAQHPPPPHLQTSHHQSTPPTFLHQQHHPIQQPIPQLPPPPPPPHASMSHHHLYPISRPPHQPHSHPSILHQPLSQPQQLPPQPPQSAPGTSRFETNSFSSKAISYEQPSYYILQYPNNDLSCSLRANNMYHNLSSTNDQITIHQSPHDSQHLSVNIAVNNPLMTRDTMATIATTAQTISSNHMNPTHLQTISTPATSSFSSTNGSTGGPSIAFLGSTSILPGRLAPSMFQALSSSSPLSAATSSSVIVNSIVNPELPQGISPVPGPAPVAVATPVSVENLTSLSTASPSNLPNEIASLSSTTFSISTQVDFSPIITNNNHSRSPSTYGSPLTVNHQQTNVATISPLVTSRSNRFTSKSVSCSTNTEPELNRRSNHHQQQIQQNINHPQSTSLSQTAITITPFNLNSSGNYTSVNNICNTSASVTNSNSSQTNNNYTRDTNYNANSIINGGNNNNTRHQTISASTNNSFLKDASVNTSKNGKDSPTINMTRKNQRKQLENNNNHTNNISTISKQRTLTNRVNKYPQSHLSSSSSSSASSSCSPAPTQASTQISTQPVATNISSISSTLPSTVNNITPTSGSSASSSSLISSSGHQQLVTSNNTNYVNSNNKKGISISNNNHLNGQLLSSSKKRPNKSNKSLIDSNLVHGESSTSSTTASSTSSSTTTTTIAPTIDQTSGPRKTGKKRLFHGWSWRGNPSKKPVFIKPDEPPQLRDCYPAICHIQGDIIKVRDSVLLRGGPRKTDLHFVAKICALWEAPETGEMMMSLLWYYRPEHTEPGRKPHDQLDEIFASKHQDVNSVACIDDKCYVLTFNEYCRYRKRQKMDAENISLSLTHTYVPTGKDYNRRSRLPMRKVFPDRVFFCRKVYDFRLGRTLKNPVPPVINEISGWRR